jgi:predicted lipid-binding transport protein (Tim44 family)
MGASGSFPIDIVLFAGIAIFLVLRLRSVLGRRQGFERPPEPQPQPMAREATPPPAAPAGRVIDAVAEPVPARTLPAPDSPEGQTLARMAQIDANFHPDRFLDGAETAFRLIVGAFAAGNRAALKPLLSDDTYNAFDTAITARETAGETQRTEIKAIPATTIEHAELRGNTAAITVRFISDQINLTLDRDGAPAAGADAVAEINDVWTFERDLGSPDPTWRLVAARSA